MDMFRDAREELVTRLLTKAPSGYRVRIIILAVLWAILFVQSSVFLGLWFRDCHRRGKSMKIIRIQKTVRGSIISVQALCAYALVHSIMCVLACIRQGLIYSTYYEDGSHYLETLFYVLVLSGACFGALAFTFSHLNAALLLLSSNPLSETNKRAWVPVYNTAFVVFPLVWLGIIVSQGVKIVQAEQKMFRAGKEVLPLLDTVLAEPTSLTPAMLMRMQSLQTIIYDNLPIVINQRRGMCLLAIVYSICFCAAGSGGLWLIHLLRQNVKETTHMLYASNRIMQAPISEQGGQQPKGPAQSQNVAISQSFNRQGISNHRLSRKPDDDAYTLHRLLRNLQISVPLCLLLATYFPIALGILYANGTKPDWLWEEFRNDIFAWPWSIINNIIFACFLYNSIRRPGRRMFTDNTTTAGDEPITSSMQRGGAAKLSTEAGSAQHVLNIHLDNAYPPTSPKESEATAEREKREDTRFEGPASEKISYPWD